MTSEKLEKKGQSLYIFSKIGMFCGLCAIALTILIGLIALATGADFIEPFIFEIDEEFAFAYFFVIIDYLAVLYGLVGLPIYFYSLNIFALGKVAHNTEKE